MHPVETGADMEEGHLRISEELVGKHVFVTGGSGFMGKVLLEKLLRSCPDLECIYVLLRPKKGVGIHDRLNLITGVKLFEQVRATNPAALKKLRAVAGDCSQLGLGLSAEDEALLVQNVQYVFHAAATVRFDDPLRSAILLNTRGTREVVELAKKMTRLKVLQYVSTTYCFTNIGVLEEKHYQSDLDWRVMIRLAETEDAYTLDTITHKILQHQPNTYTFTKALAENVINDARSDIPVIIFRPAVVVSSISEPFIGWLDNLNGPYGIWIGALKGVLRFSYGDPNVALSFTPVDWAIRGMIVCAVAKALKCPKLNSTPDSVDVVNMEGSKYERSTFADQCNEFPGMLPYAVNAVRYPSYHIGTNYLYYWLGTVFSELTYGLLIDTLLRLKGMKPRMIAMYRKIFNTNNALAHFMLNEFPIETQKCETLHEAIPKKDRSTFGIKLGQESNMLYDRENTSKLIVAGAFKYLLNEEKSPKENLKHLNRLYYFELCLKALLAFVLCGTLGRSIFLRASNMVHSFV